MDESPTRTHRRAHGIRWFLGELLVVVTGVLIAIGLNSWWQGRQDQITAHANIRRLASELALEEQSLGAQERAMLGVQAAAASLLREFQNPNGVQRDTILRQAFLASNLGVTPALVLSTSRMVASGQADVRNDALRDSIRSLIDYADRTREGYRTEYTVYEHYGDLLRDRISATERLEREWRNDSVSQTMQQYHGVLPFTPHAPLRFTTDARSFLNDRMNFDIADGLYDTGSDLSIYLTLVHSRVKSARQFAESLMR